MKFNNVIAVLFTGLILGGISFFVADTFIFKDDQQPLVYMDKPVPNQETYQTDDTFGLTFTRCNNTDKTIHGEFYTTVHNSGVPIFLATGDVTVLPGCEDFVTRGRPLISLEEGVYNVHTHISYDSDSTAEGCSNGACVYTVISENFRVLPNE